MIQAVTFFALLGGGYVALGPFASGAALFSFFVTWTIAATALTYVLPWTYVELGNEPVDGGAER